MGLHFHNPLPFLHLIHFFINPFLHFCDPLKILFCRSTLWLLGTLPLVNMYQARDQPPESTKGFEQECVTGPCFSSCKVYMHKERGSGNVADQRSRQRLGLCISIPAPSDAGEIWGGRNDLPFKRQEHKLELEEQTAVELMMFHEAQAGGEAGPRDIR